MPTIRETIGQRKGIYLPPKSSIGMSMKQKLQYRRRAKQGDMYEVEGIYGEPVYLPKIRSDVRPWRARQLNIQRLQRLREFIEKRRPKYRWIGTMRKYPAA